MPSCGDVPHLRAGSRAGRSRLSAEGVKLEQLLPIPKAAPAIRGHIRLSGRGEPWWSLQRVYQYNRFI